MTGGRERAPRPPLIDRIHLENFRALRDVTVIDLGPFTVLIGPNGSGKSTFFDVFAFLGECFTTGVRGACDRRNGLREIRSRGGSGPVVFKFRYREAPDTRSLTYRLEIDEDAGRPYVLRELLRWTTAPGPGRPRRIIDFVRGEGTVYDEETGSVERQSLEAPDALAVNVLGQLRRHPRVAALRRFVSGWYLSCLSVDAGRGVPAAGPQEKLSRTGDNLTNVLQFLDEQHPDRLVAILDALRESIPRLRSVRHERTADGRLVLWFQDSPFEEPVLARFASDGTMKMLAYLTLLSDPSPAPFIGIEEPENHLYPTLLGDLADVCRSASAQSQVFVTTHSQEFVSRCRPGEVLVVHRDESGYAVVRRVEKIGFVADLLAHGADLGSLWAENYLDDVPEPRAPLTVVSRRVTGRTRRRPPGPIELEILVEEQSAADLLKVALPRWLGVPGAMRRESESVRSAGSPTS